MKEELYTIPVNEALEQDGECLFCTLNKKLEADILNYILGPSYMEEDIRGETDKLGFCKKHYRQMYGEQNRLGVALMTSTHLKHVRGELKSLLDREAAQKPAKKGLFKKSDESGSPAQEYLAELEDSCYACNRMESRMKSYIGTFFHLWKKEPEFIEKIKNSKGFCFEHLEMLLKEGKNRLSDAAYAEFLSVIAPLELKQLDELQEDVDWFIQKFDYRFKDEPWKNSKDALPRAIQRLAAIEVED